MRKTAIFVVLLTLALFVPARSSAQQSPSFEWGIAYHSYGYFTHWPRATGVDLVVYTTCLEGFCSWDWWGATAEDDKPVFAFESIIDHPFYILEYQRDGLGWSRVGLYGPFRFPPRPHMVYAPAILRNEALSRAVVPQRRGNLIFMPTMFNE